MTICLELSRSEKCPEMQTWENSKNLDFDELSCHGTERVNTFNDKLFSENYRSSLKIFKTLKGHNSLNFDLWRKFQTFLEFSDIELSKKWIFGAIMIRKMSRAANVRKVQKPRFWRVISSCHWTCYRGQAKIFCAQMCFFDQ